VICLQTYGTTLLLHKWLVGEEEEVGVNYLEKGGWKKRGINCGCFWDLFRAVWG